MDKEQEASSKEKRIILCILIITVLISTTAIVIISIKLYNIHKYDNYIKESCNTFICIFDGLKYKDNIIYYDYNITVSTISKCNKNETIIKNMTISILSNITYCDIPHYCYYKCPDVVSTLTIIDPKKLEPAYLFILLCMFLFLIGCLPLLLIPWKLGCPSCINIKKDYERI